MKVSSWGIPLVEEDNGIILLKEPSSFDKFGLPINEGDISEISDNFDSLLTNDEDADALLNRFEDKFIVDKKHLPVLMSELGAKFKMGDIDTDVRYNRNKTIYFDNEDLNLFMDCVLQKKPRIKVRIRQYAPNLIEFENVAYVEFKVKQADGMVNKARVRIPDVMIQVMICGGFIPFTEEIVNINKDLTRDVLKKRIEAINSTIKRLNLREQITIEYERRAFSGKNVRVTIDECLQIENALEIRDGLVDAIKAVPEFSTFIQSHDLYNENKLIVEVKHHDDFPTWIRDLLNKCGAQEVKFSKYAAAMVSEIEAV